MQKILRRVATAERVATKRQKVKDLKHTKKENWDTRTQSDSRLREIRKELKEAKKVIKDDWAMGPIAPRHDVGKLRGAHGAIGEFRYSNVGIVTPAARNARCQWAGGFNHLCLAPGDRVVLLDGPDKGRIGKISDIDYESAEVVVDGLNKSNIRIPEYLHIKPSDPVTANIELPIPISAVRLVHPITDPSTGATRDVIISQLVYKDLVTDRQTGKRRWERVVPGLNVSIPWPPKPEKEVKDHKVDTLRIDVEEKTFVPTLLRPPMPEAIIDELRGKYSRFRTRHDPEYIARKEAEEQSEKERAKLMDSMRTPLQEFHREERKNKKKKGKPRLTLEMLEKIGEVIAKNRERTLNAAGASGAFDASDVSDVSVSTDAAVQHTSTPDVPPPAAETAPPPPPTSA